MKSTLSAALEWPALAQFIETEQRFAHWAAAKSSFHLAFYEFIRFAVKQAWSCLLGMLMLLLLIITFYFYPKNFILPRYDFLVISAVTLQFLMIYLGLETKKEAKVILVFHVVGTIMEIFKTAKGSWIYPEFSYLRIGGVPLFTGFMYAAVGSYLARVRRLFDFSFTRHPSAKALSILSVLIYINFFTHHYTWDIRYPLFIASAYLFGPCWVHFKIWKVHRKMPMLLGLVLVSLFIWFAENVGTFTSAWLYPNQKHAWTFVSLSKLGSWYLLMLISYTMVYLLHEKESA